MIKTILITGGTGLVGKQLTRSLVQKGYKIHLLVRNEDNLQRPNIKTFKWDIYKREIDKECINEVDAIIHLAGEEIAAKRWTDDRKQQIIDSRVESIKMIYDLLRKNKNQVNHVISASAVGYYGDRGEEILTEESLPSKDFLAETCILWEEAVDSGEKLGLRIVKLRSGIILDRESGVLPQLENPLKFGIGAIPAPGTQWVSWIHLDDAIGIYIHALENEEVKGVFNMCSQEPVTLEKMIKTIAVATKKSSIFFYVPKIVLKIVLGEMSLMVLESTKASSYKINKTGYTFEYPNIEEAAYEIYNRKS